MNKLFLVVALAIVAVSLAAKDADEVKSLPGWDGPLPSKHYSGLVPVDGGMLHYYLVLSENDPTTDPLVLWLNGGPGSSSLIGMLTENGQLRLNDNSLINNTGAPTLFYNEYNWARKANVFWLEQPKGVGFSYCNEGVTCVNNDTSQAEDVYTFMKNFLVEFSEFADRDFYITGESYAGTYIPEIMNVIDTKGGINLKGAAIGDGCVGNYGTCGGGNDGLRISVEFYHGMAMFSQVLYQSIVEECGNFTHMSVKCDSLIGQMETEIGNFDIYNVFDTCGNDQVTLTQVRKQLAARSVSVSGFKDSAKPHPQLGGALNDYVCGAQRAMEQWLDRSDVQEAIHVSKQGHMQYRETAPDLRPLYKELANKYRILIYSGSVDGCVPFVGSEEWTRSLGFKISKDWHPWHTESTGTVKSTIRGGYAINYVTDSGLPFSFITVAGAGHLVPQHKPHAAYDMVTKFLQNEPF
eukprot:m.91549 g.91549  ORF g.91549 m.91549 type:complete len:465 (-) comp21661_c0_seq1:64-1458(-)